MKQILLVIVISCAFVACKGKKADDSKEAQNVAVKAMSTAPVDEKAQKIEELKKAPQLTLEQMRVLMPTELDSAKERNYLASTQFGYGLASVEYPKTKGRSIKVTLYDCAGEAGSVNYFENYWNNLNVTRQTDQEFTKTVDFGGGKAIETYKNESNFSTFTFVIRGRLVIIMEGKNMKPEELESAATKLHKKIA